MMGMRWTNWLGLAMLMSFLFIHEPIWLLLEFHPTPSGSTEFDSTKILWAIPVVAYVIVGAVLLMRGGSDD
ncbi:MAG: hypothetical protein K2Q17_18690 [Nitrospiraceae bacterium]|uniref:hypothetical protein n=1 Tax=Nitrospira cf. moscoviensis SBR1015 TaxID=96242 RepID=UPI000A0DB5C7|nr:hypothetical protein [Nitrospira cf. moscoviensis SBR1015]MBY0249686.1 hypothetical protein [Nitrospiraceae bacterium]OQW37386.1 MAG: hypothetical protein A4E20_05225 [Nitrospira sp. SG-bin2]